MVIQPGFPNDNLPSDCASAASVVLSSLAEGDGAARVPAKINFKMSEIFIIRAFLQRACLLIISVAFAGPRHPGNFSFFRSSESVASKKLSGSSIARTVGLLQSQSSEIALALRICAKADSNAHRYVSATDQARRFASASSAAPTSNPITTFATDASGPKTPPLQRVSTPAAGRT